MSIQPTKTTNSAVAKVTDAGGFRNRQKGFGFVDKQTKATDGDQSFRRDDGVRVEDRFQLSHLQQLLEWFQNHKPPPTQSSQPQSAPVRRQAGRLTKDEFKEVISKVLGTHQYDDQLDNLFTKLDTSCDGYVDWNDFSTYLLLQFRENDYMRAKKSIPFQQEAKIRHIVHNRQETTTKMIAVDNPIKLFTISKEGAICCWDTALHLEKYLPMTDGEEESKNVKRRVREWVTDVLYMHNSHKIVIASTGRDLRFFDATSSSQFYEEFYLFAMPNVPYCLAYHYDKKNPSGESMLMYGDDHGNINIIYFIKPLVQMFATPFKKEQGVQRIYYQDLIPQHEKYVRLARLEDVHPEVIRKMVYMPENECIISSSASSRNSVVILDVLRKKKRYVFKINKGVECFDYDREVNLLVTGSADHLVRLWSPYVTSKPVAILEGHSMAVIDVVIHQKLQQVFSYSRDTILKVWDIKEHVCLQTVTIKFPSSLLGRMPEYGAFSLLLQYTPNILLVSANDYVAMLKVGQVVPPTSLMPNTHQTQLCAAIYNSVFKQVVTGADDSTIGVWDLESGAKSMLFANAHGSEEITCITFDNSQRRLLSGARNGTIKVWNIQNGHNLQQLEAIGEAEVTGIVPLIDKKVIISVGWSRMIVQYQDNDPDSSHVKAIRQWKPGQLHQEDILSVAYLPPTLLATASYDGEIYVWALETESLYLQLRKRNKMSQASLISLRSATPNSRPNSRHRKSHRPTFGQHPPVDKLLFLVGRTAKHKRTEAAILLSSEAGNIRWWSIYGGKHELGYFYAPEEPEESVLALCTDPECQFLVSGDTRGRIVIWNIENYCLIQQHHRVRERPTMKCAWNGHDSALVSVEWVVHEAGTFVLSASTDKTAKLWDTEGHCVGVFGQKQSWNIRNPTTWLDVPPEAQKFIEDVKNLRKETMEDNDDEQVENEVEECKDEEDKEDTEEKEEQKIQDDVKDKEDEAVTSSPAEDVPTLERGDTLSDESIDIFPRLPKINKAHTAYPDNSQRSRPEILNITDRARTFAFGFDEAAVNKHLLGTRVESHLSRITQFRHDRREQFGEVSPKQTSKMGKLCCPYQALVTKDLSDISLPSNLPLTPRMLSRGYTSATLNADKLRHTDVSYVTGGQDDANTNNNNSSGATTKFRRQSLLPSITTTKSEMTRDRHPSPLATASNR